MAKHTHGDCNRMFSHIPYTCTTTLKLHFGPCDGGIAISWRDCSQQNNDHSLYIRSQLEFMKISFITNGHSQPIWNADLWMTNENMPVSSPQIIYNKFPEAQFFMTTPCFYFLSEKFSTNTYTILPVSEFLYFYNKLLAIITIVIKYCEKCPVGNYNDQSVISCNVVQTPVDHQWQWHPSRL